MPANSRDTQGPQNKDKASLTPHRGQAHRKVRPRGPKPGSQEHPRQENEVSARAGVGMGALWRTRCQVARDGLTLSPGSLTCVSCRPCRGFSAIPGASRKEMWAGRCPGTAETRSSKRETLCKSCPALPRLSFSLCQRRVLCAANATFLLLPTRLIFCFPPLRRALVYLFHHFVS